MSKLDNDIKASRRSLEKIDKLFATELEKLKKIKADRDSIEGLYADWSNERDNEEHVLDSLLSRKLSEMAKALDLPLPHRPVYDKDNPDWDHNEHWYRSPVHGGFVLSQRGRDYVDEAIWKKEERKYNRWARWVTLMIGLVGTLIGLVSVTASNWEKLARIWKHH